MDNNAITDLHCDEVLSAKSDWARTERPFLCGIYHQATLLTCSGESGNSNACSRSESPDPNKPHTSYPEPAFDQGICEVTAALSTLFGLHPHLPASRSFKPRSASALVPRDSSTKECSSAYIRDSTI